MLSAARLVSSTTTAASGYPQSDTLSDRRALFGGVDSVQPIALTVNSARPFLNVHIQCVHGHVPSPLASAPVISMSGASVVERGLSQARYRVLFGAFESITTRCFSASQINSILGMGGSAFAALAGGMIDVTRNR